ncbi:hypothetical protein O0L34_g9019 [Tuta absoluta]|nr:hypothetical protein O0L34_g9019 [Tuta absoluta]
MLALYALLCLVAVNFGSGYSLSYAQPSQKLYDLDEAESIFEDYIKKYNKEYVNEEEKQMRFTIFKEKLELVNKLMAEEGRQASFDVNHFSDWSQEEFESRYLGFVWDESTPVPNLSVNVTKDLPDSFDWREKNAVTPVKDQGQCGICWAFSLTGAIEGAYAIKHKKLLSFSEQQLLDCDTHKCKGQSLYRAYLNLKWAGGMESESDYPYVGEAELCSFNSTEVKAQIVDKHFVPLDKDDDVKHALINYGPMSIIVHAGEKFQNYNGNGILDCPADGKLNHAVLLVGYGTENGRNYWIIKNSWSSIWGDNGYIKVAGDNPCGMKSYYHGLIPIVK